jgi:predicted  nucleic acid-binding Zn-ribbon protein
MERAITVADFFRCTCGKLHASGSIGPATVCTCGVNLWHYVFNN